MIWIFFLVAGSKNSKARSSTSNTSNSESENNSGGGGGNRVHPRETPAWQKKISSFFSKKEGIPKENGLKKKAGNKSTEKPEVNPDEVLDNAPIEEPADDKIDTNNAEENESDEMDSSTVTTEVVVEKVPSDDDAVENKTVDEALKPNNKRKREDVEVERPPPIYDEEFFKSLQEVEMLDDPSSDEENRSKKGKRGKKSKK